MLTLDHVKKYEVELEKNGFFLFDLDKKETLFEICRYLENILRDVTQYSEITLERYHHFITDETEHTEFQYRMFERISEEHFIDDILSENLDIFKYLLGPDLDIQAKPYIRIARPGKSQDNIGFHRDTFYGTAPDEISVWIPFVDLDAPATLSLYSGSHLFPDSRFPTKSFENTEIKKGSKKNLMGFLYSPKLMDSSINPFMRPVPVKKGEALVFFLSTVHGSVINSGSITRWSSDIRIKNRNMPLNPNMKPGYYRPLHEGIITRCFKK